MPARLTTAEFVARARRVHGDRYDYSSVVYANNRTKVTVICPVHGPFATDPGNHIKKRAGCRQCSIRAPYTTDRFIARSREAHGDRYGYERVDCVNSYTPVTIVCPVHGPFQQTPASHVRGKGCPTCGRIRARESRGRNRRRRDTMTDGAATYGGRDAGRP